MSCKHERVRCTDNVYHCALCGASWVVPPEVEKDTTPAEKAAEAPKRAAKRVNRKKGESE